MTITLDKIKKDNVVTVDRFNDDDVSIRLSSFGVLKGVSVTVISKLPFNGAVVCECKNTKFVIRAEDAAKVVVIS